MGKILEIVHEMERLVCVMCAPLAETYTITVNVVLILFFILFHS